MATKTFTPAQLVSIKLLLTLFLDHGGLVLNAYIEQMEQKVFVVLSKDWTIHGITQENGLLAILASVGDQIPMRFVVRDPVCQALFEGWLQEKLGLVGHKTRGKVRKIRITTKRVPARIVFITGVTMHVPGMVDRHAATPAIH